MAGKKGAKKRFWSDEEKRLICEPTRTPFVSVAQLARRYAMNANLIRKWLRDPRFSPDNERSEAASADFCRLRSRGLRRLHPCRNGLRRLLLPAHRCRLSAWT